MLVTRSRLTRHCTVQLRSAIAKGLVHVFRDQERFVGLTAVVGQVAGPLLFLSLAAFGSRGKLAQIPRKINASTLSKGVSKLKLGYNRPVSSQSSEPEVGYIQLVITLFDLGSRNSIHSALGGRQETDDTMLSHLKLQI